MVKKYGVPVFPAMASVSMAMITCSAPMLKIAAVMWRFA